MRVFYEYVECVLRGCIERVCQDASEDSAIKSVHET